MSGETGSARPGPGDGGSVITGETVNHPRHYNNLPVFCQGCGRAVECIDVIEVMPFNVGTAMKYLWRFQDKTNPIEDLKKAVWYIQREIENREKKLKRERGDAEFIRSTTKR